MRWPLVLRWLALALRRVGVLLLREPLGKDGHETTGWRAVPEQEDSVIRAMTHTEIRAALLQSARVCIEQKSCDWWRTEVMPQDGAYYAAMGMDDDWPMPNSPEEAATWLLLVREALC